MYSGFITKLSNVRKHSNADRLMLADCFGMTVIVGLDAKEGDKVVYFPADGQLDYDFCVKNNLLRIKNPDGTTSGGYLDPEKRNIRTLKLRGENSDGLVLSLESLSDYVDIKTLKVGDAITTLGGTVICQKYIPRRNPGKKFTEAGTKKHKKEPKIKFPFFDEHKDTEQLAYNLERFKPGDTCYITLKLHGTSARTMYSYFEKNKKQNWLQRLFRMKFKTENGYDYVSGTRRVVLNSFDGGFYGSNSFRQPWHDFFKGKLHKGEEIFYEIVGYTSANSLIMGQCENKKVDKIMGNNEFSKKYGATTSFTYGCDDKTIKFVNGDGYVGVVNNIEPKLNDIYCYRMTMTTDDGVVIEYPWELVKYRCEQMGVKTCLEFDKFLFTTKEDLMARVEKYYDGDDPIGKTHIKEGCVVRIDNRIQFSAFKHKNISFKILEGIIKDSAESADMEESQEETKE